MASLKPFDESRKIKVFCEKTCQALFFLFFKKTTLSSYKYNRYISYGFFYLGM